MKLYYIVSVKSLFELFKNESIVLLLSRVAEGLGPTMPGNLQENDSEKVLIPTDLLHDLADKGRNLSFNPLLIRKRVFIIQASSPE